ncbi:MAG: bifunctional hydroxymethylpyrimidine kinase/phosphomethylpyrimidine kinase [Selenomonadaceae bacterium]|nr:bifunctional hydroxymethylpyrimidine kinase/phosphomethylpyrimidine kinase [Selenomonadaceae bacterium]
MNKEDWQNFFKTKVGKCKVLVIGDIMMDKYYYGDVKKFASDAPVPVAKIVKRKTSLGAAANIANNLASLGCQTAVAGFVGDDHNFETLSTQLSESGIDQDGLIATEWPTTTKVRIMSGHVQMFRMDFEDLAPRSDEQFDALYNFVKNRLNDSLDAIILADYEKGVCTERFCDSVITAAHNHGVPVVVMPYGQQWIKYAKADYVTPNVAKINKILLSPISTKDDDAAERAGRYIMRKFQIKNVLATRSSSGITLVTDEEAFHVPTRVQEVFDSAGAADTVAAVFAMALAGGLKPVDGAYIANVAAGIVLRKSGTYAITREDMLNELAG